MYRSPTNRSLLAATKLMLGKNLITFRALSDPWYPCTSHLSKWPLGHVHHTFKLLPGFAILSCRFSFLQGCRCNGTYKRLTSGCCCCCCCCIAVQHLSPISCSREYRRNLLSIKFSYRGLPNKLTPGLWVKALHHCAMVACYPALRGPEQCLREP